MSVSILTLNIWHDSGPWKQRAERIRAWIDLLDPDLVGFQEVLVGEGVDQVAEILEGRLPHRDYVAANRFWRDRELAFGNAVASRWPITDRQALVLPDRDDGEKRAALIVRIDAPVGEICFASTHLNWKFHHGNTRERQVVAVCDAVLAARPRDGFPPVLVGDFNAEPGSDEIRYVTGLHSIDGRSVAFHDAFRVAGQGEGITWSNRNPYARVALEPERRIDYVFTGFPRPDGTGMIEQCRVVCDEPVDDIWPSDHFGVFARLRSAPL